MRLKYGIIYNTFNAVFKGLIFSKEIEKCIIKKVIYKNIGDFVQYFDNASKALGIVFLKFDNQFQAKKILNEIEKHITLVVE